MVPATQTVNTSERLQALRQLMSKPDYNVAAVVVPSEDQRKSFLDPMSSTGAVSLVV